MSNKTNSELIMKKARKLKASQAPRQFNAYEYLMKHNEKACLANLPVDLPDVMYIWMVNGKKLILINENARISFDDLNRELTVEIAKMELSEHANDESVKLFTEAVLA